MSYTDQKIELTVDLAKVKAAAANLKADPNAAAQLKNDPKSYLAKLGVEIDGHTASLIKERMSGQKSTAAPAAVMHIDA